jgi:hypothetical protein
LQDSRSPRLQGRAISVSGGETDRGSAKTAATLHNRGRRSFYEFILACEKALGRSTFLSPTLERPIAQDSTVLDRSFLNWPFFDQRHCELADELEAWARIELSKINRDDVDSICRQLVGKLGTGGWLRWTATDPQSAPALLDLRALSLMREILVLARHDALADFSFAMQGLGIGPIALFGSAEQRCRWLPLTRAGKAIAAFALSEPASGSDVARITTVAARDGDGYWLEGEKDVGLERWRCRCLYRFR